MQQSSDFYLNSMGAGTAAGGGFSLFGIDTKQSSKI